MPCPSHALLLIFCLQSTTMQECRIKQGCLTTTCLLPGLLVSEVASKQQLLLPRIRCKRPTGECNEYAGHHSSPGLGLDGRRQSVWPLSIRQDMYSPKAIGSNQDELVLHTMWCRCRKPGIYRLGRGTIRQTCYTALATRTCACDRRSRKLLQSRKVLQLYH